MKAATLFLITLLTGLQSQTQRNIYQQPSRQSQAYHEYRMRLSIPPYGLARVKALAEGKKGEDWLRTLNPAVYNKLSFREQFTYNMLHGEAFAQNCSVMPRVADEQLKIAGQLPDIFDDMGWSKQQDHFFINHRDSVLSLIREDAERSHRIGLNYKLVIVGQNAREMVPFLIKQYNFNTKDHDMLTVLMLLMEKNGYKPFLQSQIGKTLYGGNGSYRAFINFNTANEQLIIKQATAFYYKSLER